MKRVASIQDTSCLGLCSLTGGSAVLSVMGVECAVIPTAVLSTHTIFPDFTCRDLTDELLPIARHWKSQQVHLDAIASGYLASPGRQRPCAGCLTCSAGRILSSWWTRPWPTTAGSTSPLPRIFPGI